MGHHNSFNGSKGFVSKLITGCGDVKKTLRGKNIHKIFSAIKQIVLKILRPREKGAFRLACTAKRSRIIIVCRTEFLKNEIIIIIKSAVNETEYLLCKNRCFFLE